MRTPDVRDFHPFYTVPPDHRSRFGGPDPKLEFGKLAPKNLDTKFASLGIRGQQNASCCLVLKHVAKCTYINDPMIVSRVICQPVGRQLLRNLNREPFHKACAN